MRRATGLFERLTRFDALVAAARRAARGKAMSEQAARFLVDLEPEVFALQAELHARKFAPRPYRTFAITDPKPRVISAAAFRDRVVHHALCAELSPIFERVALPHSYACRVGFGAHRAVREVQRHAHRWPWFVKLDVASFFETADHAYLKALLRRWVADEAALALCDIFIDAGAPGSPAGTGLPIGNLTSQHFANAYLTPLDRFIKQGLRAPAAARYMDDILVFGPDKATVRTWSDEIDAFVTERMSLKLRADAHRLGPTRLGVPFLGFRVWPRLIRLDAARARRARRHLRALHRAPDLDDTERAARVQSTLAWLHVADAHVFTRSFFDRLASDGA